MLHNTVILRNLRKDIGHNIHRLRAERQLPLYKLSMLSGVPIRDLDYFELGKSQIGLDHIVRIACVLECNYIELLVG